MFTELYVLVFVMVKYFGIRINPCRNRNGSVKEKRESTKRCNLVKSYMVLTKICPVITGLNEYGLEPEKEYK